MKTSLSSCPWLLGDQDRHIEFTSTAEGFDSLLMSARNRAIVEERLAESVSEASDNGVFSVVLIDGDGQPKEIPVGWQVVEPTAHTIAV